MNLALKKTKRGKRVALGDLPEEKRTRKVSSLEDEEPTETLPVIRLGKGAAKDGHDNEPDGETHEWYEEVDSLPEAPNADTYRQLSVADFGAALRRGMGVPEPLAEPSETLKSHDHTGIGFNSTTPT